MRREMPRPALHGTDVLLDAARDLVIETGPRAVGIRDIAKRSGAPSGSLYHRFQSRDKLVALAWLRAARRFQTGFVAALGTDDPFDAIRASMRWSVGFALSEPADTQLLLCFSQGELLDAAPPPETAAELAVVNVSVENAVRTLTRRLFRTVTSRAVEVTTYAVIDLPYAVLRRHLLAGTLIPRASALLESAAIAIVTDSMQVRR
ncbi:MAG TPA: helix-turn-helix domain-containing protein [Solirubrobacteraceae bacterium]|jgi:AcrR family transcriptional regulator|nr:helix-turn-helix domain-containing protein [Solirubrobacteraceae bacterium]